MDRIKEWVGGKLVAFLMGGVVSGAGMLFTQYGEIAKLNQMMVQLTQTDTSLIEIAERHNVRLRAIERDVSNQDLRDTNIIEDVQEIKHDISRLKDKH